MKEIDLKNILFQEFNNVRLNLNQYTLFEASFYDWTVCQSFKDYKYNDLLTEMNDLYPQFVVDFYKSNINSDKLYIEPFHDWAHIPSWYFKEFNEGGIINLGSDNFLYYLCASIYADLTGKYPFYDWMVRINYPLEVMQEINHKLSTNQRQFLDDYFEYYRNAVGVII